MRPGNCVSIEHVSILHVSSRTVSSLNIINSSSEIYRLCDTVDQTWTAASEAIEIHDYVPDILSISEFSERVIAYMASFIVKYLRSKLYCETCIDALTVSNSTDKYNLIKFKNRGGLCYPSDDVYTVCHKSEKAIRFALKESSGEILKRKYSEMYLTAMVLTQFLGCEVIFQNIIEHAHNQDALENHRIHLIRCIIQKYVKTRLFYISKSETSNMSTCRQFYTNLIQFKGH